MKMNPNTAKSIYVFSGSNPRIKKILVREHNRFELTQIRLDSGKFFKPIMDESRRFGKFAGLISLCSQRLPYAEI